MQIDMHYYGTYAMARAAGIRRKEARIIATSAQFVDDNVAGKHIKFNDGSRIDTEATAHYPLNLSNLDEQDQRRVWVPFHFIPGNVGDTYTERLKSRMDSGIIHEICDHHLEFSERPFALQLIGIAAHVYADTFSHYGFSGVSSRGNKVDNGSFRYHEGIQQVDPNVPRLLPQMHDYVTGKLTNFFTKRGPHGGLKPNINGWLAEAASGALGHGSVATLPDRPYLVWSFEYERADAIAGICSTRNNPATFLAGCRALHGLFDRFVRRRPDLASGNARDFEAIRPRVQKILLTQANQGGAYRRLARCRAIWRSIQQSQSHSGICWRILERKMGGSPPCQRFP